MTVIGDPPRTQDPPAEEVALSRRSLLGRIGLGAVTVAVVGAGAASYRVYDNGVLDAGEGTPYEGWSNWQDHPGAIGAVAAAVLAANPHNSQSWTFAVQPSRVDLFLDAGRRTGTLDPLAREQHIGLGCALENLVLAASARGLAPTVTLMPSAGDPTHVASVDLATGSAVSSPLYDAIPHRHSNRGPYTSAPVAQALLDELSAERVGLDGVDVRWFTTTADRAAFGGIVLDATEAIIADRQQSIDAFAWFRNDRDDIDRHRDGLTLDCQGLDRLTLTLAKILPAASRAAGDKFWLDQTRTVHTATAAAYGVIIATDVDDAVARLDGGRLVQRIHLAATSRGLAIQHTNQITERIDRERTTSLPATFALRFDELLGQPAGQPLLSFRIGHPVRPARRSPRRSIGSVTR